LWRLKNKVMKQPTKRELRAEFKRLSKMNKTGKGGFNSFREIGSLHGYSHVTVRNLLLGDIPTWRIQHYTLWESCKLFVKIC
jgi:hypothetical protein